MGPRRRTLRSARPVKSGPRPVARDLTSLRGQIEQHVLRNPGDWTAEHLFEQLVAFDAGNGRFGRFIEGLVSADLIPDELAQRAVADVISPRLREAGAELRETGSDGGYPVFSVVPVSAARHRQPKNLVFASQVKPDIRISDAGLGLADTAEVIIEKVMEKRMGLPGETYEQGRAKTVGDLARAYRGRRAGRRCGRPPQPHHRGSARGTMRPHAKSRSASACTDGQAPLP